jgi:Tol biopolymer transport system component
MTLVARRIRLFRAGSIALISLAMTGCSWKTYDDLFSSNAKGGRAGSSGTTRTDMGGWGGSQPPSTSDSGGSGGTESGGGEVDSAMLSAGGFSAVGAGGSTETGQVGGMGNLGGNRIAGAGGEGGAPDNSGGSLADGGEPEAADDGSVECNDGPFQSPEQISGLDVNGDMWGPTLSADGLTLYFSLVENSIDTIYTATRTDRGKVFSRAAKIAISGVDGRQATPFLSYDGLTVYFVSERPGGQDRDLWSARRARQNGQFSNALPLAGTSNPADDRRPWVTRDELTLLFASTRGGPEMDIYTATRTSQTESFSTPVPVPGVSGPSRDESPIMTSDGLTLYLASSRPGGLGKQDIWVARRSSTNDDFGRPEPVTELNSAEVEVDMTLSADEREMFFASSRSGSSQIWRSVRNCRQAQR